MSVIANYELAQPLSGTAIAYGQKNIFVKHNKGTPEQEADALRIVKLYNEKGPDGVGPASMGMARTEMIAEASRIVRAMSLPDEKELYVTAVSVGDVVFAGFPGEPFTQMGRDVKNASKFISARRLKIRAVLSLISPANPVAATMHTRCPSI
jgi:hypothetical protein